MEPVNGASLSPTGGRTGHDHLLDDLADVNVVGAAAGQVLMFTGGGWVPSSAPWEMENGEVTVSGSSVVSGGFTTSPVVFDEDRFTVAPLVIVSLTNAPAGTAMCVPRAFTPTAAGFSLLVFNAGATTLSWSGLTVAWWAVQMTEGSATG